ncbi:Uncharacterised protein [Escherichia coli]|uniref:Uncharacterized protein n=1 Tax=Escherichia coli TaxID=562 RepID=A0A376P331_ECOLX|nr:Uncharacterised protein [Escherichia coli]
MRFVGRIRCASIASDNKCRMLRKCLIWPTDSMRFVGRIRCASIASDNKCRMLRKCLIRPTDSMRFVGRIRCASIASDNKYRMRPTFTWRFLHLTVFIEVNQTTRLDNLALFSSQTFHIERNFRYRRIFMDHITLNVVPGLSSAALMPGM